MYWYTEGLLNLLNSTNISLHHNQLTQTEWSVSTPGPISKASSCGLAIKSEPHGTGVCGSLIEYSTRSRD